MNLLKKIEEIRRQPEHVRLKWVWGCVAVSMAVILIIWFFSITMMFRKNNASREETINTAEIENQIKSAKDQVDSIKNYTSGQINNVNESADKNSDSIEGLQYSSGNIPSENSESANYSDLENSQ